MTVLALWRGAIFLCCLASFVFLLCRFFRYREGWNAKTRDYWYALSMWSFAGMTLTVEGILRNSPFRYSIVFVTFAALVSLFGLRRKGGWGSDN